MEIQCQVCGRPLHDPVSIARGMGPKCAGVTNCRKSFRSSSQVYSGTSYSSIAEKHATTNLFSFIDEHQDRVPDTLRGFPSDLVNLVLTAPAAGAIAAHIKMHSRHKKQDSVHAATVLKQIRRICIEFRLLFWPGISMNLEPIPCIPCGENDWRLGENGRVCSKDELVAYLARYGIISSQLME